MSRFLRILSTVIFLYASLFVAWADGTRNFVAPEDTVGSSGWDNEACLYLFNALEANPNIGTVEADADERFYIHIENPSDELIYLGFKVSNPTNYSGGTYFRVKAPDGSLIQDYTEVPTSGAGYIRSYKTVYEGPSPTTTSGGYLPIVIAPDAFKPGDYYIEFNNRNSGNTMNPTPSGTNEIITFQIVDISVGKSTASPSGQKTHDLVEGRFFAYQFPMTNFYDQSQINYDGVDFAYYVYHDVDKVVTRLNWRKVVGGGWIIMFNDRGPTNTGDLAADRKSNATYDPFLAEPKYPIFFAVPDANVYEPTDIVPNFEYEGYRTDCASGLYAFFFSINRSGRLEVLMEFDSPDGVFDPGTSDLILIVEDVTMNRNKVLWDGEDGLGVDRAGAGVTFSIKMVFSIGSMNNPMFDVEQVMEGIDVDLVSPTSFGWPLKPNIYFDDSNISNLGNVEYGGCNSNCHIYPYLSWQRGNSNYNYGDRVWINSWWTAYEDVTTQTISALPGPGIIPIDTIWGISPTSCATNDGEIYIEGLIGGDQYTVSYKKNNVSVNAGTKTADGNGIITLSGLSQGDYDTFVLGSGFCSTSLSFSFSLSCVTANDAVLTCQVNPGLTNVVTVPSTSFTGASFGTNMLTHISFETFPSNANSITIGSTTYTSATFGSGVEIAVNASGNPIQAISVDPMDNVDNVVVYFKLKDNQDAYSSEASVIVPFPNMTLSADVTSTACEGGVSGALDLSVSGGQPNYSYWWIPGDMSTQDVSGLSAGWYIVTVTDDYGCSVTDSFEVTPTPIAGTCDINEDTPPTGVNTNALIPLNTAAVSGSGWSNLSNILTDNSSYADESINSSSSAAMIYANSFDFSAIPSEVTINGIEVIINRYASGSGINDDEVQLSINSTVGSDYADGVNWTTSTSGETNNYGGASDLWGFASISRADLSTLELQYLVSNSYRWRSRTAYLDYIAIRVYYTTSSSYVDNQSYTFSISASDYPAATGFSWSISRSALVETVSGDETTATFDLNNRGAGEYEICVTPYNSCATGTPCCTTIVVVDDGGGASILGTAFADVDLDGLYENGDPGVDSVLVILYEDMDGDGSVSAGDTQVDSEYTDSLGNYLFTVFESLQEDTVSDDFSTGDYTGNTGSQSWATDWVVDGATYVYVSGGQFVFHYLWAENAYREIDLTGATSATLSFDWSTSGLDADEELDIEISSDGGSNYTSLASFGNSPASGVFSQDISAYIASNMRIRFINNNANWESGEYVYVDNVSVIYSTEGFLDYVLEINPSTLPLNATMTTDNVEVANLTVLDPSDDHNDFGIASADVLVAKNDGIDVIIAGAGGTYTYQLLVTNNGPTNAGNVVVTESWPAGFTQGTISTPTAGTLGGTAPNFTWTIPSLAKGQSQSVNVSYTVPVSTVAGLYVNEISVTSNNDFNLSNNTATDSNLVIDPYGSDYGDAPASYDVGTAASHERNATPEVYLGTVAPDKEDGAQSGLALADDTTGVDDEDAFSFFPPYTTMRSSYTLHVPITNTSGDSVTVAAWIDMDGDGTFDTSERASKTVANGVSVATLVWSSLPVLPQGLSTYIRLRIASDKSEVLVATGSASDGEVEDYPFEIYYAGDCPTEAFLVQDAVSNWYDVDLATASYQLANDNYEGTLNGVGYNLLDGLIYGYENTIKDGRVAITSVDATTTPSTYTTYFVGPISGLPTGTGYYVGDVGAGKLYLRSGGADVMYIIDVDPDSPDYLSEAMVLNISGDDGANYTDMVYLPSDDMLYAINNKNGDLHRIHPTTGVTTIIHGASVPSATYGAQYLDVNGFMYCSDNTSGDIYRVSLTGNPNYEGVLWATGPVSGQNDGSRCPLAPVPIDFGDAPAYYITEVSVGNQIGARHAVPLYNEITHTAPLMLGNHVDVEIDGQPSSAADGDDVEGIDDEDGLLSTTALSLASTAFSATVTLLNNTGNTVYLSGFVDFDCDSTFGADERVTITIPQSSAVPQTKVLTWTGLNSTVDVVSGQTYMRLRISSQAAAMQNSDGIAIDGEVEDYILLINDLQTDSVTKIEETSATLYGRVWTGQAIEEYGFYYGTDSTPSNLVNGSAEEVKAYDGIAIDLDSVSFSSDIMGLSNRSGYYFRTYMKDNADSYYYGNVVRFISERRDFSLSLDGDGDALVIDKEFTASAINRWEAGAFSVEFWLKKGSATTSRQVLISNASSVAGYQVVLINGSIVLESTSGATVTSPLLIDDEMWHYVAISYNGTNAVIYIDNNAPTISALAVILPSNNNCFIGAGYNGTILVDEFEGNLDAMRFWSSTLTAAQAQELACDLVYEGMSNTVQGVGSGRVISGLAWESLTASLGFNVKSTEEADTPLPVPFLYENQTQLHQFPFFHNDARLQADKVSFNLVALGQAKPSPYLPRVYWNSTSASSEWLTSDHWSGHAFPGEGATTADYPDVTNNNLTNDSAYCLYTIVDSSATSPLVTVNPPEVQVLVDRHDSIGTYRVDESASELTILKGIHSEMFDVRVDNESSTIIIEEGAMEVFHD